MKLILAVLAAAPIFLSGTARAAEIVVQMNLIDGQGSGKAIGTVTIAEGPYGIVLAPALADLPPGVHGFHLHQNPDCAAGEKDGQKVPGLAAGGHFDPAATGKHEGPYGAGHLGDLPALTVDADGKAALPVLAPRLQLENLTGRSLMIHAGGDNYADAPAALGGGGARLACGVIR